MLRRQVLYDAGLHKRKQQIRFLARALTSNDLMAYPAVIGKEAAVFFKSLPNEVPGQGPFSPAPAAQRSESRGKGPKRGFVLCIAL